MIPVALTGKITVFSISGCMVFFLQERFNKLKPSSIKITEYKVSLFTNTLYYKDKYHEQNVACHNIYSYNINKRTYETKVEIIQISLLFNRWFYEIKSLLSH